MSDTATLSPTPAAAAPTRRRLPKISTLVKLALVVLALYAPFRLDAAWLQTGLFAMAAIVAAIGLTVLVGAAGQLSLAHSFFIAIGAYAYSYFAGASGVAGASSAKGLGLPTTLSAVLAVVVAGFAGLLFSPIASRLKGIYLGVASLSLVFIGDFAYENFRTVTGGFNGRAAPAFSVFGFEFSNKDTFDLLGVPFGKFEKLWMLYLLVTVLVYVFASNVLKGRMGRAMQTVRDSEVAAAVMGVDVRRTKTGAFVLSSMYAGLGGVLLSLVSGRVTPSQFGLVLSISYLAAIVIGGLGSVGGAALGATFVFAGPIIINRYSGSLPFVAEPGSFGYDGGKIAALIYGAAVILVVLFEPGGLVALGRRLSGRRPASALHPAPQPTAVGSLGNTEEKA